MVVAGIAGRLFVAGARAAIRRAATAGNSLRAVAIAAAL